MAEKRMFSLQIVDSDAFLELPASSQALFFHLGMRADDEGFINNPKKICRMISASEDDLKLLITKLFVIPFESGVVVMKHWRINNTIQKDRFKPTAYQDERKQLIVKQNGAYSLVPDCIQSVSNMDTKCIQSVSKVDTQSSIDQIRLDQSSIEQSSIDNLYGVCKNVYLLPEQLEELKKCFPSSWEQKIDHFSVYMENTGKQYGNHFGQIYLWGKQDEQKEKHETGDDRASILYGGTT